MDKLKPKEKLFCYYYAKLRNSKEAAIKAGYYSLGAESQADKLLMKQAIIKQVSEFSKKEELDDLVQCIISGLKRLAFSSANDSLRLIFTEKDELIKSLDSLDLFHIAEIKMPKENVLEVKLFDRFKAFEKLIELTEKRYGEKESNDFYQALEKSASSIIGEQNEV